MFLSPVERTPDEPVEIQTPQQPCSWRLIWAVAIACAVAGVAYFAWPQSRVMLAVLPFEGAPADGQLVDGLTDKLTSHLGSIGTNRVGVIARSSVMRYKAWRPGLRDIACDLGIQYVVEGAIQHDHGRVGVTARLVKVSDQALGWTESYEEDEANLFRVEQDSAARVTAGVVTRLFSQVTPSLFHATGRDAYEAYRTGRALQVQGSLERSLPFFDEATRLDPKFADAFAARADACVGIARSVRPGAEFFPRAAAAAGKALELDRGRPKRTTRWRNVRFWFDWNWTDAERHFKRALVASERTRPHITITPGSWSRWAGPNRASRRCAARSRLIRFPSASTWTQAGCISKPTVMTRRSGRRGAPWNWRQVSRKRRRALAAQHYLGRSGAIRPPDTIRIRWLHIMPTGEISGALDALEQAYQHHSTMLPLVNIDPVFISLHGDHRFTALVEKIGIK